MNNFVTVCTKVTMQFASESFFIVREITEQRVRDVRLKALDNSVKYCFDTAMNAVFGTTTQ